MMKVKDNVPFGLMGYVFKTPQLREKFISEKKDIVFNNTFSLVQFDIDGASFKMSCSCPGDTCLIKNVDDPSKLKLKMVE